MARSPKNGKSGPTETVATTLLMPPATEVQKLGKLRRSTKKRSGEVAGEYGSAVAKAVESKHVDRKALSIACALNDMSDEKLHVTYHHLMEYIEHLGVRERATAQEEMFQKGQTVAKDEGDGQDADEGNVTRLGTAARKVAAQAGAAAE